MNNENNTKPPKFKHALVHVGALILSGIIAVCLIWKVYLLLSSASAPWWLITVSCIIGFLGFAGVLTILFFILRSAWRANNKTHIGELQLLKDSEKKKAATSVAAPATTKKWTERLKKFFSLWLTIGALAGIGLWFYRTIHQPADPIQQQLANVPIPADYSVTFADVATTHTYDFSEDESNQPIRVGKLRGGGYNDQIILPKRWKHYVVAKSKNSGDWASVWCDGHPNPGGVFWFNRDDMGPSSMMDCYVHHGDPASFRIQGKGWIQFVPTAFWY